MQEFLFFEGGVGVGDGKKATSPPPPPIQPDKANLKPYYSIGGCEWIFISHLKNSAAFTLHTSENNLKPP